MKKKIDFLKLKGDLSGGLAAAILSVTCNIAYGMISFAPLGSKFIGIGIIACMFSSVFNGTLASIFGSTKIMISGPLVPATFIIASVITKFLSTNNFNPSNIADILSIISIVFFIIFLSGIMQILFGLLRLGTLIKNISDPVVLGIINGTAVLIIISQLSSTLGLKLNNLTELFYNPGQISITTVIVSVFTILIMFFGNKYKTKFPPVILSVLGGTIIYHLLKLTLLYDKLGPVIGEVPFAIPSLSNFFTFINIFPDKVISNFFPIILPAAFAIAILGSIESLMIIISLQNITQARPKGNKELIAQGIGNSIGALFGSTPVSGSMVRSTTNYSSGGRTKLSGVLCGIFCLFFILILGKTIEYIPMSVMSAIIIYICVQLMNNRSVPIINKLFKGNILNKNELLLDLFIVLTVMVIALVFNIILAVAIGILISIIVFMTQMSRSIVRKIHRHSQINSKKQRFEKLTEILQKEGNKIYVIELEGAIFFGSADNLADRIDKIVQDGGQYIVLDMKRISRIDSTGCKVLEQTYLLLKEKKIELAISYIDNHSLLWSLLTEHGLVTVFGENRFFPDTSLAVEYFEDIILEKYKNEIKLPQEISLDEFFKYIGIDEKTGRIISDYLEKVEFSANEKIITYGDTDRSMFLLIKGSVDVIIPILEQRKKRLQTNTFGSMFGEMSLIDGTPRSADIIACESSVCFKLSINNFYKLINEYPKIALKLYAAIALITAKKLRSANHTISELEA
ncbi:SLC26A/SulP transporter family protein [Candidatus Desantisbacteria bacterium]|nr:SLC26A/SulP transporter family protein [Candidatus Desantisbacteria bacterium]